MKTKHLLLLLVILSIHLSGNSQPFVTGDKVIDVGLGLGSTLYSGVGYNNAFPPLFVSFEYGVTELGTGVLGIGAYLGLSAYKWNTSSGGSTYGWKYSSTIIGARGNYHYSFVEKLDTYAGLILGYNIMRSKATGDWPSSYDYYTANSSSFIFAVNIGGRYYFSDSFAAMMELEYGIAWLKIGVAFKF